HMGDVYYAGEEHEQRERLLDVFPKSNQLKRRFALNGNHDMYSGGHGYFEVTLKEFGQAASYFCLRNANWQLIALDTAYKDHDLKEPQLDWLKAQLNNAGGRKNVLLTHHQMFSCFEDVPGELSDKIGPLLDAGKVHAWFWGHEHKNIVYLKHRN